MVDKAHHYCLALTKRKALCVTSPGVVVVVVVGGGAREAEKGEELDRR